MRKLAGLVLLLIGVASVAMAGSPGFPAPEIDPGSVISIAALMGSGLIMLRGRFGKK